MIPVDGGDVLQQGVVERPTQFAQHQGGRDVSMADRGHEPADLAPPGSYMRPSKRGRHKSKLYARYAASLCVQQRLAHSVGVSPTGTKVGVP